MTESFQSGFHPPFSKWVVDQTFFDAATDGWERIEKILKEIQKRSLAEQVFLVLWNRTSKKSRILSFLPEKESPAIGDKAQSVIMHELYRRKEMLTFDDLLNNRYLRQKLHSHPLDTMIAAPVNIKESSITALILINYSGWGQPGRVKEFIGFASSVLDHSLQNVRIGHTLQKKQIELNRWRSGVEKRLDHGTQQLLEKEFQYYVLFEGIQDGIIIHEPGGCIKEVNKSVCRLLGYEKEDILRLFWDQLAHPDALAGQNAFFQRILNKEKMAPLDTQMLRSDHSTLHVELSSRTVRFRGTEVLQSVIRDAGQRKRIETGLRRARDKYKALVELLPYGIFVLRDGQIQYANTMFEELTGLSKQNLIDTCFYDLVLPEFQSQLKNRESRLIQHDGSSTHDEALIRHASGRKIWTAITLARIIIGGRAVLLGHISDISDRKALEQKFIETQKLESIGTLAGGIAHDFNNLLGGILGYSSLILSDLPKTDPIYPDICAIAETAKRAADLTHQLLAFARGGKYQVTTVQVNELLREVLENITKIKTKEISIHFDSDPALWAIRGDSRQIYQVFLNICTNALEAIPETGEIRVRSSNQTVPSDSEWSDRGVHAGEYACISIADTGIGMDEKTKQRIFEPFFSTKNSGGNTGLGLSVVYGVVRHHDGFVFADSEIGKGTTLTVFLPRFEEPVQKEPVETNHRVKKQYCILLADDEKVIREVGRRMLEKNGFQVLIARNGKEALELYQSSKGRIDLVLLDLIMPQMGGRETFRQLRKYDPLVNVGFTSGYSPKDRPELLDLGEKHYIQKPFQTEVLISGVRGMLSLSNT